MGGLHNWVLTFASGPNDGRGGKMSFESPYTALGRAESAAASRARLAPQSRVIVRNKFTGLVIFAWYGEDWVAGPVEEAREVPRGRYCLNPVSFDSDDVCLRPDGHKGVHSATAQRICERPQGDGLPCGFPADYRVMVGSRQSDAEEACEFHLGRTVVAMLSAENREITAATVMKVLP